MKGHHRHDLEGASGMGRKRGFSFSWKRALGISGAKASISRKIGIPLTRSGRERKIGRMILGGGKSASGSGCGCLLLIVLAGFILAAAI